MTDLSAPAAPFEVSTVRTEARRRFAVRAVFFIYILSLIEGPLRKWFLPGLAGPLTLLRDPFVIMLYAYCLTNGLMWKRGIAKLWLGFAVVTSLVGLAQYAANGFGLQHWMLGVRTYWLYMPLAFVVAKVFRREDFHAFLRLNMIIAIPYALLVSSQYNSSSFSFINRGVGGDDEQAVGLTQGIVRPFGLFTYTGPNVQFTAAMTAMFIAFYIGGVRMRYRTPLLILAGAAVGSMSVLTGSRLIYFLAAMIVGITVGGLLLVRPSGRTLKQMFGIAGFALLAIVMFVNVFPDMLEAMAVRFDRAAQSEGSIWNRAFGDLFIWADALMTAPFLGEGIGAGAPGVARILGLPPLIYGESDLQRNINELGFALGILMLMLRFGTSAWIVWVAVRLAKRREIMALPLAGFVFLPMFMGQITHSPLSAFEVWLFIGFIMSLRYNKDHYEYHQDS